MGKISKIEEIEIKKLIPYENNAKIHSQLQIEKLKTSIERFGFLTPCLIDQDLNLIAGHGRVQAARALNMIKVPCVFIEGLDENQRKAYILADNKLGELAEWDLEILNQELEILSGSGIDASILGFDLNESISQEINSGIEIDIDDLNDESFKHLCPECGFRFN